MNEEKYREVRKYLLGYIAHTAKDNNISIEEITEKTGLKKSNIKRLFEGKYNPDLEIFIILADAVGIQIQLNQKL